MAGFYVVFKGTKPGIYASWHECSAYVLGVEGSVYKKYSDFASALRDFDAYCQANSSANVHGTSSEVEAAPLLVPANSMAHQEGLAANIGCWKNSVIATLLVLVFGMGLALFFCNKCK